MTEPKQRGATFAKNLAISWQTAQLLVVPAVESAVEAIQVMSALGGTEVV